MFITHPDLKFLPIPDLEVKKAPDPGFAPPSMVIRVRTSWDEKQNLGGYFQIYLMQALDAKKNTGLKLEPTC
jgi:hypothetical protein